MPDDATDRDGPPSWFDLGASDDPSIDTLVDALTDRRTRYAVAALESRPENDVELHDLVDRVVEREVDAGRGDDSADHRERVAIALHHRGLPKLDDAAVLDYDARTNTVRYWDDGRVSAYLEFFDCEMNV